MTYLFPKEQVAQYLLDNLSNDTPIKIQKGLYFLWAYYSATYGNIDSSNNAQSEFDSMDPYPEFLFEPNFQAWMYGPVDPDIYHQYKSEENPQFSETKINFDSTNKKEIQKFMDNFIRQINEVNDFGLVSRSHQDSAWSSVYREGIRDIKIDPNSIKENYKDYVSAK